jgi:hypothetical protein
MREVPRDTVELYANALKTAMSANFLRKDTVNFIDTFLNNKDSWTNQNGTYWALVKELQMFLDIQLAIYEAMQEGRLSDRDFMKLGIATGNQIKNIVYLLDDQELERNWERYADNPASIQNMRNMYERTTKMV